MKLLPFFQSLFKADSITSNKNETLLGKNISANSLLSGSIFRSPNSPAQNDLAMNFLSNHNSTAISNLNPIGKKDETKNDPVIYEVKVQVPRGAKDVSYDQLHEAVIKAVYQKNGITLSKAAVEDVAQNVKLDFTPKYDGAKKDYVYNQKNGLMMDVNDKANHQYVIKIRAETEKEILSYAAEAKEITASGKKAFSELTMDERLKMLLERSGKDLPQDAQEALKLIDPKMLIGGMAVGAGLGALAEKGAIASESLVLVGGAMTMAQLMSYMGDAEHILDQVAKAKSPTDLDAPAKATAELIKSGAVDVFLTLAGYGVGKAAPRVMKTGAQISEKAVQYSEDAARLSKSAQAKGRQIIEELNEDLQKIGKSLISEPELATPDGITIKPREVTTKKSPLETINDPMEARANESLSGAKKAVNLPSWDKLTVDIEHITSGHKAGGSRLDNSIRSGKGKDVFPEWINDKQILSSIEEAYSNAKKVGTQDTQEGKIIELVGYSKGGMKIKMYINTTMKTLDTAFPQFK